MISGAELADRLSRRVELASPFSPDDCLHQLHIRLASSRHFAGKVDANTVLVQRLQDIGMVARADTRRLGHLELSVMVEAYGAGAHLSGEVAWPTFAKVVIAMWSVLAVVIFAPGAVAFAGTLSTGGTLATAFQGMGVPLAIIAGMAACLAYRFNNEKRALVEFVAQATKAGPLPPEQRRRAKPIVE